jgi:hypothetical protein
VKSLWFSMALLPFVAINVPIQTSMPVPDGDTMHSPHYRLESSSRLADKSNPATIDTLTQVVLSFPHTYRLPEPLEQVIESRLAISETAYRNGVGPGVTESQMVDLMNSLAETLRLPDYAKTTPLQIRVLRMALLTQSPHFMGSGMVREGMRTGESINQEMSPLQAMHLFSFMVDQKILNPEYQDPDSDPAVLHRERKKEFERIRQETTPTAKHILLRSSNPKGAEMREAISSGFESMSMNDALNLLSETLSKLDL